ncbi:hypothetical protein [endosymbiont GvMRE of Glomus versiforme]|uniref:hypothetical protein n=1 Tax=endosymbiont GvMRE of Glomus versiforme TaxID=2039283 RepID=UPI000ECD1A2D|nr:hypothetical protein [endosymbiont GvMRE of Glomus versiforme]RHZ35641.1 hypothetical protein GvMRE_IIg37 [endosymbiont GvMRE of Glomus versiforme]
MSKSKKLQKPIQKKLDQLSQLLDKIDEARMINSDDTETWDSDALYNLAENLKEALALLEDKESKQKDDWGQPIVLETGLYTLVDEYNSEEEDHEDYD